jgi:hypothetical protein
MVFCILHLPSESQPVVNIVYYTCSHRRAKQFRDLLARKHGVDSGLAMIIKQRAKVSTHCAMTAQLWSTLAVLAKSFTSVLLLVIHLLSLFLHHFVLLTIFGVLCGEPGWGLRLSP